MESLIWETSQPGSSEISTPRTPKNQSLSCVPRHTPIVAMAIHYGQIYLPTLICVLLLPAVLSSNPFMSETNISEEEAAAAVARFQEYLQIDTSHPDPAYTEVTAFLRHQAESIGLDFRVLEFVKKKPLVLLTWRGSAETDGLVPSVLLNSHTDVCPVESSKWTHPPFSAHVDQQGRVFARGSQDMKSVGIQYLEAARRLKRAGFRPWRSVHFSFLPDEEIGSDDGAKRFYESAEFEELNVGVVLDEGVASTGDDYRVFNGEKAIWWLVIKATGSPSHGSNMVKGTALDNLRESVNRIARFRDSQLERVGGDVGEVVSIANVYFKSGTPSPTGFVMNLQPSEAEAGFDIRLPPGTDTEALEKLLVEHWAPASHNLSYHFIRKEMLETDLGEPAVTIADGSNPWWVLLKDAVARAGGKLGEPEIRSGATDARFARFKGIPAFQFSPMSNTPHLQHSHDEFLAVQEYIKGIKVYEEIIRAYAGASQHDDNESFGQSEGICSAPFDTLHHTEL